MVSAIRFVKALAHTAQSPVKKTEEKKELLQQIQTVKTLIKTPHTHKSRIAKELARLERQLETVVVLEHQLLRQNHSEASELKNQLRDLRVKLSLVHSGTLKHRMDRLLFLMGEVGSRVDSYMSMKEHHNERMTGIEESIKKSIAPLNMRVHHVEQVIAQLEQRYSLLKKKSVLTQDQQKAFESRITQLRERLRKRKIQQLEKHHAFLQESLSNPSKKRHTILSLPPRFFPRTGGKPLPMSFQIRQFPPALPSPEQVALELKQESAPKSSFEHEQQPLPPLDRPPAHRMILSPLPSVSGRMLKRDAQPSPPELVRSPPPQPAPPPIAAPPPQPIAEPPSIPRTVPVPPQLAQAPPQSLDIDVPPPPPVFGSDEELLRLFESELMPKPAQQKKGLFQRLMGK